MAIGFQAVTLEIFGLSTRLVFGCTFSGKKMVGVFSLPSLVDGTQNKSF